MKITESALEEVLNVLITKYPNTLPENLVSNEELSRQIGRQDVIRFLIAQLEVVGSKSNGKK